jgi:hypothetical protein
MTSKSKIRSQTGPTILPPPQTILRRLAAAAAAAAKGAGQAGRVVAGAAGSSAAAAAKGAGQAGRVVAGAAGSSAAAAAKGAEQAGRAITDVILTISVKIAEVRQQAKIEEYVKALESVPREKFIAGLPALVLEIEGRLQAPRKFGKRDLDVYDQVVAPVLAEERREHPADTALSHGRGSEKIPWDDPDKLANWLKACSQTDERTLSTGQRLFEKLGRKFKDTICGEGGPYELIDEISLRDMASHTGKTIIGIIGTSYVLAVWVPLAAVLAWVIVKTGLKMYCERD